MAPLRIGLGQFDPRKAVEQRCEGDLRLHPRQVQSQARVCARSEIQVRVVLARGVETVGVRELLRIAVGAAYQRQD